MIVELYINQKLNKIKYKNGNIKGNLEDTSKIIKYKNGYIYESIRENNMKNGKGTMKYNNREI